MDVIKQKVDEPVKCPRCGAGPDDDCVCMPTEDGPGQPGQEHEKVNTETKEAP